MKIFLPELNYHFNNYWINNKSIIPSQDIKLPANINFPISTIRDNCFIDLLFNNGYNYTIYNYLFVEVYPENLGKPIYDRLFLYKKNEMVCYITSLDTTTGNNIFNIVNEDVILLDKLLEYRTNIITPPTLTGIDYNTLTSKLAKLIFIYLNLVLNDNFSLLNNITAITVNTDSVLLKLFELYVLNESEKIMSNWSTLISSGELKLRPVRSLNILSSSEVTSLSYKVNDIFYSNSSEFIYIVLNGDYLTPEKYSISGDSTSTTITLINTTVYVDDIIVTEYFKSI